MADAGLIALAAALVFGSSKRKRKTVPKPPTHNGTPQPDVVPTEKCEDPWHFAWDKNDGPLEFIEPPVPWPWDGFTISDGVDFPIQGLSADDMDNIAAVQEALYQGTWRTPVPGTETFAAARKVKPDLQWPEFGALHLFYGWTYNSRGFVGGSPCTSEEKAVFDRLKALIAQTSDVPKWVDVA